VFKSLAELNAEFNLNLNLVTYMRLRESLCIFRERYRNRLNGVSGSLLEFFRPPKGEVKKIRRLLDKNTNKTPLASITSVETFLRLTEINLEPQLLVQHISLWSQNFLVNKFREFCFRFFYNQLSLNTRLSHYVINVSRTCTVCCVTNPAADPAQLADETFIHLFLDCPLTVTIQEWFSEKYLIRQLRIRNDRKIFFFTGSDVQLNSNVNLFDLILALTVQFLIWNNKCQKRALSPLTLDIDFRFYMENFFKHSSWLRSCKNRSTLINNENWDWLHN
jgi:hypothetical protein